MNLPPIKIAGIIGSLRAASLNRKLLMEAFQFLPEGAEMTIVEIGDLPLFNQDLESDPPQSVLEFWAAIKAADALLISTPEYNYTLPAPLKNAIDWASRPPRSAVLRGKPYAVMGASGGVGGTIRAQMTLRHVAVLNDMPGVHQPEVRVTFGEEKFDEAGHLKDQATLDQLKGLVHKLVRWTRLLKLGEEALKKLEG